MEFIIFILVTSILAILFYQHVDRYTVSSQSCSPCPAKSPNTYYVSVNGCSVAQCRSCPSGKRVTGCTDANDAQLSGDPGTCV